MQKTENISVFTSGGKIDYYPVMIERDKPYFCKEGRRTSIMGGKKSENYKGKILTHKYPSNVIDNINWIFKSSDRLRPTQKPVPLLEYLIKTYTNEGYTVLDFAMGSGSTAIACLNTNRKFIGIEKDDHYFQIAKERLERLEKLHETNP